MDAHYVLKVKDNPKQLNRDVKRQFNNFNNLYGNDEILYKKTVEKAHDRSEIREYFLTYKTNEIKDKTKWETVNAIAYVKVQTMINDEIKTTEHYYIIDYKIDIETLEKAIRYHWNINGSLH